MSILFGILKLEKLNQAKVFYYIIDERSMWEIEQNYHITEHYHIRLYL
jgi:hypothetical protein